MSSISASAMRFKRTHSAKRIGHSAESFTEGAHSATSFTERAQRAIGVLLFFLTLCSMLYASLVRAELIDRVVAFVDEGAITLSELKETFERTKKVQPDISEREVLNTMINRLLLLNEAKRLKIEAKTEDDLLNEYIELKVRAVIRLKEEELEEFYRKNRDEFKGAGFEEVREKIEAYLTEQEVNRILKSHIAELRSRAYVKIVKEE